MEHFAIAMPFLVWNYRLFSEWGGVNSNDSKELLNVPFVYSRAPLLRHGMGTSDQFRYVIVRCRAPSCLSASTLSGFQDGLWTKQDSLVAEGVAGEDTAHLEDATLDDTAELCVSEAETKRKSKEEADRQSQAESEHRAVAKVQPDDSTVGVRHSRRIYEQAKQSRERRDNNLATVRALRLPTERELLQAHTVWLPSMSVDELAELRRQVEMGRSNVIRVIGDRDGGLESLLDLADPKKKARNGHK